MRLLVAIVVSGCGFRVGVSSDAFDPGPVIDYHDAPALAIDAPPLLVDAPPDAAPGSLCANNALDPGELDIDCGGPCQAACTNIFTADANTLAVLELNGTLADTSGNNRNATLIAGGFVSTSWGMGLSVAGNTVQGLQWTTYANLLVHPYTVEIVIEPESTSCYRKLFGGADNSDSGWYFCKQVQSFQSLQNETRLGPNVTPNNRHYLAFVTTSTSQMDVYLDGTKLGSAPTHTQNPPTSAIFFRDDTATQRSEEVTGTVDAIRISKVARTATEIAAVKTKLDAQP